MVHEVVGRTSVTEPMKRQQLLNLLSKQITSIQRPHPIRVGVDGIDAAGKSIIAAELTRKLLSAGRPVITVSTDDFHNPRRIRYRQGRLSPDGYYQDSFNYQVIRERVLDPLSPGGDGRYRPAAFDYRTNQPVEPAFLQAAAGAILIFDGIFLGRPELVDYWDLLIFIDITFETCLARALVRDRITFVSHGEIIESYQKRYIPGQQIYLSSCQPKDRADLVIDNNDPSNPVVVSWKGSLQEPLELEGDSER